ncbi:hypothetical protein GX656_00485 [Candidatus Dojkabacteria bacterium]|uniref:Uncharacterized protein n=1 Tax=Candidatus Dojkabacteria bacterium TaxID=2099670 RepID=A0A847CZJ2_9BACT|nr:hypothetical protein [Candidatus Dojkabacteria bacterium]
MRKSKWVLFIICFFVFWGVSKEDAYADMVIGCPGYYQTDAYYRDPITDILLRGCWAQCTEIPYTDPRLCNYSYNCVDGYYFPDQPVCGAGSGGPGGCTYESCTDCTLPTCSAANGGNPDYTTNKPVDAAGNTIASPLAACIGNSISCNGTDNCGDSCNPQGPYACYLPETNLNTIPTPAWNRLKIGVLTSPNLSTNSSSKTLVHYPLPGATISSETQQIANPTGSRELRYNFILDSVAPGTTQTSNTLIGQPNILSLIEGKEGSIKTTYQTLNKCDNNLRSGSSLTTYYKVNTLPRITSLTISGESGDQVYRGCAGTVSFTGKEVNNPLIVTIKGTDADSTASINGTYLWLVKDGTSFPSGYLDKRYAVGPGATATDPNIIGLFLTGGVYKSINSSGSLNGWGRDTHDGTSGGIPDPSVKDSSGNIIIKKVEVLTHEVVGGEYTMVVKLIFPDSAPESQISGKYNMFAAMTDTLSYYDMGAGVGTFIELRSNALATNSSWNWNFDFVNPNITNFNAGFTAGQQRIVDLNWSVDGTGSNIKNTIVNVYKTEDPIYSITRISPSPQTSIDITTPPSLSEEIGIADPISSGWENGAPLFSSFNINNNSSGTLTPYVTAYDQACNFSAAGGSVGNPSFDLNRWISTKGGILFSSGRISYMPKTNSNDWNTGTELIGIASGQHPGVQDFGEDKNPVSVINIIDRNNQERTTRFGMLGEKLDKQIEKHSNDGTFKTITAINQCNTEENCILMTESSLTIPATTYRGRILVLANNSVNLVPDIKANDQTKNGLIIFSSGKVSIDAENLRSTVGNLVYDEIDALVISNNQITIPTGTEATPGSQQDGVKIIGSLLSFGNESNPGVLLQRNLGLLNVTNPVLIVNYHPKYAKISEIFFGTETAIFKQEVGFKN